MNLKEFNEIINLVSVFFQLVPIFLGILYWKKHEIIPIISCFIFCTFFLDLIIFYQYKFLKLDVGWLNNFYILNAALWLIPFYFIVFNKNNFLRKILFFLSIGLIGILVFEFIVKKSFNQFNSNCWLAIQLFTVLNSLLFLLQYFQNKVNDYINDGLFYYNLALIIAYSLPTFVNIFQPYFKEVSKQLYTTTFIIMNLTGIIFSIFIIIGLQKFKEIIDK